MGHGFESLLVTAASRIDTVYAVFAVRFAVKALYVTNNTEHFKSGCALRVAKPSKTDWFLVLQ